jgi:hypothetical protein
VCAPGKWLLRRFIDGKYSICTLGWADDLKEADGESVLSFAQAETKAKTMLLAPAARSAPQIAEKFATFQEQGIVPACHLYRHYDPTGDLLYVGISLDNLKRQYEHSREAAWRSMIFQIIVEPFATREEALEAEEQAIRTEFPKYNVTHNGHRHPFQEFAAFERSRARRDKPSKSGNSYSR